MHFGGDGGKRQPCGAKGSVCPVGTWAEGPKRPAAHRREASARWAVAQSAKRPAGVSKYKGCARPARRTPIFARERNERWARPAITATIERPGKAGRYELTLEGTEGSVCPVGTCHRRWQSAPEESTETSGGRGQRSPRRLRLRTCGPPSLPKGVSPKRRGRVPAFGNAAAPLFSFRLGVGDGPVPRGRGRDGGREGLALP